MKKPRNLKPFRMCFIRFLETFKYDIVLVFIKSFDSYFYKFKIFIMFKSWKLLQICVFDLRNSLSFI